MSTAQPSFSTGTVLDPTRNALAAITTARESLSDMLNRNMKQEALDKAQARQKILDDRATAEYNYKVGERNALGKFNKAILAPNQTYYGDVNNSKAMEYAKNVELTPEELKVANAGGTSPAIEAKLKAQENFGKMITNDGAGYKENEWQKAQRVAKEQGVGDSPAVAQRLYDIKAADTAARTDKETKAVKQKDDLLTQYNKTQDDIAKLQITKQKYVKGTKSDSGKLGSKKSSKDQWTADDVSKFNEQANKFTPSYSPTQGDSGLPKKLMTYAQTIGVGPKTLSSILVQGGFGGEENYLSGEKLTIPTNKNATDKEIANYYRAKIDEAAAKHKSNDSKGTDGFYYNPEDTSTALKLKRAQAAQLKAQIAGIRTDYNDDGLTPQEHSMQKINALAEKYWNKPIPETTKKSDHSKGGKTGATSKSVKAIIGGAIGKAVNIKGKGGELAKLVTEQPEQFGKEYDLLDTAGKAKVNKILQSDASTKYLNNVKTVYNGENKSSRSILESLLTNKTMPSTFRKNEFTPGELDILHKLNPTGMTDSEKTYANLVNEDKPLEDMSAMFIPMLKGAKTVGEQLTVLTRAGYTRAEAEALIRSGKLKLLPRDPGQINVPAKGFTRVNRAYDISMPAMRP